ncbi:hypothetical protein ACFLT2_00110 [Acidobacteriota bacterium]
MSNRLKNLENRTVLEKTWQIFGLSLLTFFILLGSVSCQKAEEAGEEEGLSLKEGALEFEGTIKVAHGKYAYIPEASGFDIIIQGDISGGIEELVGKEVKGEGEFSPEMPALLVANNIEVKGAGGDYQNVFTRVGDVVIEDYLSLSARDEVFPTLDKLAYNKNDDWEGKEKAKVFGKLERGEDKVIIVVFDEKGKQTGSIVVDSIDEIAEYYMLKLTYFDKFWFYLDVKETVDWRTRRRTRELFHADIIFAGLY